ncbi:hypothetical protein ACFVT2_27945 [Streptomyces sp. NPDC058000]|uniref:hypothetical protein n=1 Tax=Streptomyces sp. NPDC058000 TaxID=3346299 RepID=UPI0036E4E98E
MSTPSQPQPQPQPQPQSQPEPEPTARGSRGTRAGDPSPAPEAATAGASETLAPAGSEGAAPALAEAPAPRGAHKPAAAARPAPRNAAALIFDDPLSQQSSDDTDRGWGERPTTRDGAADLARFLDEKPPHHL